MTEYLSRTHSNAIALLRMVLLLCVLLVPVASSFAERTQVRVGVLSDMNGTSEQGRYFRTGIKQLLQRNPEEGIELRLFFEDSRGDSRAAIAATRRLIDVHRVSVVLGFASELPANSHAFARDRGVPILAARYSLDPPLGGSLVFNFGIVDADLVSAVSAWASTRACRQPRGLITDEVAAMRFAEDLAARRPQFSIVEEFRPSEFDFRQGLRKAAHRTTDCVIAAIKAKELTRFFAQSSTVGLKSRLLVLPLDGWTNRILPNSVKHLREVATLSLPRPQGIEVELDAEAKIIFAFGYELAKLVADANSAEPEGIRQSLTATKSRQTSLGRISYEEIEGRNLLRIKPQLFVIWNRQLPGNNR